VVKAKVSRQFEMSGTPLFLAARLAAATMLLALSGCGASQGSETETGAADSVPPAAGAPGSEFIKVVNVETATVEATDFTTYVRLTGMVEANSDVTVSAEETGVLTRFFVAKGSRVRAGQALAKIDDQVLATGGRTLRAPAPAVGGRADRLRNGVPAGQVRRRCGCGEADEPGGPTGTNDAARPDIRRV
jgi:multidrug efflux pump subunit AcrA (membrane-fusion protein)